MPYRRLLVSAALPLLLAACSDSHDPPTAASGPALSLAPSPSGILSLGAPVFGLSTNPDGSLLAATPLTGITELRKNGIRVVTSLANVSDVAAVGGGNLLAITGEPLDPANPDPSAQKLFRVSEGHVREIADLGAFERTVNPDGGWNDLPPHSNPFRITHLRGGTALIADASGNSLLIVDESGEIDWIAVFTPRVASTAHFKSLIGCTDDCGLPPELPAEPVPNSIAVGPDGAYYVGELTGFPAEPGLSRIWRIAPGSRHVLCPSSACTLVADGFTSIMDLAFGPDGRLYVVEMDKASWLATVLAGEPFRPVAGGRVQACNVTTGSCAVVADDLSLPTAVTVGKDGTIWVAENDAINTAPGYTARIRALP